MIFDNPKALLFLWTAPVLWFFLWLGRYRTNRLLSRFIGPATRKSLLPPRNSFRRVIRLVLLTATCVLLILAAARPQFGVDFEEIKRIGADIFVVLDVSRSMLAEDVPPNRLARAKSEIRDFLGQVNGDRVGLIVFAGKPRMLLPLTVDTSFFLEILDKVDTESAPRGGTVLGDAIRLAIRTMPKETNRDGAILLITDGEDHESFPLDAAKEAAAGNMKIFSVAMGNAREGARIPLLDEHGNRTYQKYEEREIWSKADTETLQKIAEISGGSFVSVQTAIFNLGKFYTDSMTGLQHGEYHLEKRKVHREQFPLFLLLAITSFSVYLVIPK